MLGTFAELLWRPGASVARWRELRNDQGVRKAESWCTHWALLGHIGASPTVEIRSHGFCAPFKMKLGHFPPAFFPSEKLNWNSGCFSFHETHFVQYNFGGK